MSLLGCTPVSYSFMTIPCGGGYSGVAGSLDPAASVHLFAVGSFAQLIPIVLIVAGSLVGLLVNMVGVNAVLHILRDDNPGDDPLGLGVADQTASDLYDGGLDLDPQELDEQFDSGFAGLGGDDGGGSFS